MIYADHAATGALCSEAFLAMRPYLWEQFGNPSSTHHAGATAAAAVFEARSRMADRLGCSFRELYFTSGGSEADNQALLTMARIGRQTGRMHLVAAAFEHPAVLRTLDHLKTQGFSVTLVPPDEAGIVHPEQVAQRLRPQTAGVSVMLANNEVGTLQPVARIAALCKAQNILCHCDAVQAVGHIPVSCSDLGVDMLTLSAHKFAGPKGVGALIARNGLEPEPVIYGGGQERGVRAGTENVPGIIGASAALCWQCDHLAEHIQRVTALRRRLAHGLEQLPGAHLIGDPELRVPGIVHVCMENLESETMLCLLDEAGICASAGSACSAGALSASHVLRSMRVPESWAGGALRFSLGEENTEAEVDGILNAMEQICAQLRKERP